MKGLNVYIKIDKDGIIHEFKDLDSYERWQVIDSLDRIKQDLIKQHQSLW